MFESIRRLVREVLGRLSGTAGGADFGSGKAWHRFEDNGLVLELARSIPQTVVDRLRAYLKHVGPRHGIHRSLRLAPSGEGYEIRMASPDEFDAEPGYHEILEARCVEFSVEVFDGKPVVLVPCDPTWETRKTITAGELQGVKFADGTIVFGPDIAPEDVGKLGKFLDLRSTFVPDFPIVPRIARAGEGYEIRIPRREGTEGEPGYLEHLNTMCVEISVQVFDGKQVEIRLHDALGKPLETVTAGELQGAKLAAETLVYGPGISPETIKRFGELLDSIDSGNSDAMGGLRLERAGTGYEIHIYNYAVGSEFSPTDLERFRMWCCEASARGLEDAPVSMRLFDANGMPLATVMPGELRGAKFPGGTLVHGPDIPAEQAEKLGEHLESIGYFAADRPNLMRLERTEDGFELGIVFADGRECDSIYHEFHKMWCIEVSVQVFDGVPFGMRLCDADWKPLTTVTPGPWKGAKLGAGTLAYGPGITPAQVESLGETLVAHGIFDADGPDFLRVERAGTGYELRLMLADPLDAEPDFIDLCKRWCDDVSLRVFDGKTVDLRLCSGTWQPFKTVTAGV